MGKGSYSPKSSFIRVATACPKISLADTDHNVSQILDLYNKASRKNVSLIVFPEMSLTGYTIGDLVQQTSLLIQAEQGLLKLAEATENNKTSMVVGLPLRIGNGLYDCAAFLGEGDIKGIVPKSNLPTYNEFYEDRWYQTFSGPPINISLGGTEIPFGTDLLFKTAGAIFAIEICEDLWVPQPPSGKLAELGAQIIINPSASPEQIGKAAYRRELVRLQSARLIAGYLYAGSDVSESTSEIVMGGHQLITSNGHILAEKLPFAKADLLFADIDLEHLAFDRRKRHIKTEIAASPAIVTNTERTQEDLLSQAVKNPFLPAESAENRGERFQAAVDIQAQGLATRIRSIKQNRIVLGLSGGLDSTLALLVAYEASFLLEIAPDEMIHTLIMPGPASSSHTRENAQKLATALGVISKVIEIDKLVAMELDALDHDSDTQDITYENVQARARTNLLFNYANMHRGIVLGTGDLSEIALGWCTYNADQQSHYNVNASIPKTLVKHLVTYLSHQAKYADALPVLESILATPITPELTTDNSGEISQTTETIIGPYELHDFFLYHLIRWGDRTEKIIYLARQAFADVYEEEEIEHWFKVFITRFAKSQFKRETIPNGPKVGSVSLSPRGDWRMPPDIINVALWNN